MAVTQEVASENLSRLISVDRKAERLLGKANAANFKIENFVESMLIADKEVVENPLHELEAIEHFIADYKKELAKPASETPSGFPEGVTPTPQTRVAYIRRIKVSSQKRSGLSMLHYAKK